MTPQNPAPRQGGSATWRGLVLGGLNASGFGFAVGGGAQASNFMGREEFGLQIDGLFSNSGGCVGCGVFNDDFSAKQLGFSGAFLYKFKELTNGWQPFAGGGLVVTRYSYSYDSFDPCDVTGFDCSITQVGIQAQGGLAKGNLHIEGRAQGTAGGAFLLLAGYKFGGQ
jgi:hypothetical protein